MKKHANRNSIYFNAQEIWEKHAGHLHGLLSGAICVVSEQKLSEVAQKALISSMDWLGYGTFSITFVNLHNEAYLKCEEVFAVVEAIDPFALIATDNKSIEAISNAYKQPFDAKIPTRIFGRYAVGFSNFEAMLDAEEKKRIAWTHLQKIGSMPTAR